MKDAKYMICVNDYSKYSFENSEEEETNIIQVNKYNVNGFEEPLKPDDKKAIIWFLNDIESRIKVGNTSGKKYYYLDVSNRKEAESEKELADGLDGKQIRINTSDSSNKQIKENEKEHRVKFIRNANDTRVELGNIVGVLRWKNYQYKPSGTIYNLDITLQIGSRFDTKTKKYLLPTMLYHRAEIIGDNNFVPSGDDDIFHFLYIYIFKEKLKEAYQNGLYKRYVRFERNDSRLKGSIDISRHIKLNAGQNNGKVAYSYRESTVDNPVNHLILHTYDFAKKIYPDLLYDITSRDGDFEKIINQIRYQADTYDSSSVQNCIQNCNKQISHPFFIKYEELRKVCINFLQFMGVSMFDGEEEEDVQGILFDVNDLWEEYLMKCFEKNLKSEYKVCDQFEVPVCISLIDEKSQTHGYPDYVFFDKDSDSKTSPANMILDAKYRICWQNGGFDFPDYTKCIRDMNALTAHKTGVIYPQELKDLNDSQDDHLQDENITYKVSNYNSEDYFYSIPVCVPYLEDNTSYHEWQKKMDNHISIVTDKLKEILGNRIR